MADIWRDGGQAAISELFDAADRLTHTPWDARAADDLLAATVAALVSAPPFGLDRRLWRQIQELASVSVAGVTDDAGTDIVKEGARTLRDLVREYV